MQKTEDDNVSLEFLRRQLQSLKDLPEPNLKGGGGGGTSDGMEIRVKRLEDESKDVRDSLQAIRVDLAEIKGTLKGMPSAAAIGKLEGRMDSLPTTAKVGALLGIAVAVITIITKWPEISPLIGNMLN